MLAGSFISPNSPIYKKTEKDFKKNALLGDLRDWKKKKKKKKVNLKEFLKICHYYPQN